MEGQHAAQFLSIKATPCPSASSLRAVPWPIGVWVTSSTTSCWSLLRLLGVAQRVTCTNERPLHPCTSSSPSCQVTDHPPTKPWSLRAPPPLRLSPICRYHVRLRHLKNLNDSNPCPISFSGYQSPLYVSRREPAFVGGGGSFSPFARMCLSPLSVCVFPFLPAPVFGVEATPLHVHPTHTHPVPPHTPMPSPPHTLSTTHFLPSWVRPSLPLPPSLPSRPHHPNNWDGTHTPPSPPLTHTHTPHHHAHTTTTPALRRPLTRGGWPSLLWLPCVQPPLSPLTPTRDHSPSRPSPPPHALTHPLPSPPLHPSPQTTPPTFQNGQDPLQEVRQGP